MTLQEKLALLDEAFDLDEGTLKPEMNLNDIPEYDSLTKLSIIAMLGSKFKKTINTDELRAFKIVNDILNAMEA